MKSSLFFFLLVSVLCLVARAQKVELAPLPVKSSTFMDDVLALRFSHPKMPVAELVDEANRLLDKQGMNFSLFLDEETCARVREVKQKQKDPTIPVRLGGSLKSVDGERTQLALPAPRFGSADCGGCYLDIPLLQITRSDFITVLLGRNIRFELPSNFTAVPAVLLDEKDMRTRKRTWYLPERLVPIGISNDENVLYVAFNEQELKDLSLAIFTEGTFQVATRAEADEGGKGENFQTAPGMNHIKFVRWGKTYVVGYSAPCSNHTR